MNSTTLKCCQINLQHCQAASYNLCRELGSLQTYIAMVQEPCVYKGRIKGSPPAAVKHTGIGRQGRPRACIYTSGNLDFLMLPKYSNADVVTEGINNLQGVIPKTVIFSSVYMAEDNAAPPQVVEDLIAYCNNNNLPLVIGCDANAHHVAWGSTNINERGETLMEFLAATNLAWCNKGHKPTFITKNRRSVLDLTLATPDVFSKIKDWTVSDNPSLSDHAMITFHFAIVKPKAHWFGNVRKTNWKDFFLILPDERDKLLLQTEMRSIANLDSPAEALSKYMHNAYEKSSPLKKAGTKHDPNPWWNNNLSTLR